MNKIGDVAKENTAFSNTRIPNQQNLERVIVTNASSF